MKKRYTINIERTVELEINEKAITKKVLEEFSEVMWKVDVQDIISHIVYMVAVNDIIIRGEHFIEGLGPANKFGIKATVVEEAVNPGNPFEEV